MAIKAPLDAARPLPEVDRLLLVSRQPEKRRAAVGLARAFAKALARVKHQEGVLIAQLDELLDSHQYLVDGQDFLPEEPVCLCVTGTPRLIASVSFNLASVTKARFVRVRPPGAVDCLRVGAYVRDGAVTFDCLREFADVDLVPLSKAEWRVEQSAGEDPMPAMLEALRVLQATSTLRPTPFAPPSPQPDATVPARTRKDKPGSIFAKYRTVVRAGRRR